jgi:hypothetical protein
MCKKWKNIAADRFVSNMAGDPDDLPFSASEFANACILVMDGPFDDDNKSWVQVVRMYERLVTLHIDMGEFCQKQFPPSLIGSGVLRQFRLAIKAPRNCNPFHLPFTAHEFLELLVQYDDYRTFDKNAAQPQYKGSSKQFHNMVFDLAMHRINLKEFLADHIPADLEDHPVLLLLLASAQGEHTENFVVDDRRFRQALYKPPKGQVEGPMSHLQAAMFVQSLKELETRDIPVELKREMCKPHDGCHGIMDSDDNFLIASPCCNSVWTKCCLTQTLMSFGPCCADCYENMTKAYQTLSSKT